MTSTETKALVERLEALANTLANEEADLLTEAAATIDRLSASLSACEGRIEPPPPTSTSLGEGHE